ncbi:MAG: hypothetical protein CSB48_07360 [Proteobacteria bacterium]|nr:MAG: hypothetical protein CSB48_07360 [Pseudomonadota bacterium]PIE40191.1 MAG: hypothetical protein CSA51_02175 [Gammaproteobacteria bacterium]
MSNNTVPPLHGFDPVTVTPLFTHGGCQVDMLRLDLIDSIVSGNKWFKLKYNLHEALSQGYSGVMSFGGAHSNHLHALAGVGKRFGLPVMGFVRCQGGRLADPLSETLIDCQRWGMVLKPLTWSQYRLRYSPAFCSALSAKYPDYFLIPEGGSNPAGVKGVVEMLHTVGLHDYDYVVCPTGSGGTLAGVASAIAEPGSQAGYVDKKVKALGISALKGLEGKLEKTVAGLLDEYACEAGQVPAGAGSWRVLHDFHCGGFGKVSRPLISFKDSFQARFGIELDLVYTAKMMYAVSKLLDRQEFPSGSRILVLHTGGLQGNRTARQESQSGELEKWPGIGSHE